MSDALDQVMGTLDGQINAEDTNVSETTTIELDTEEGKADPKFIHMPVTAELLAAVRVAAGTEALGPWLQRKLAADLGVTLPVKTDGRQRYSTEEQRKAAKVAAATKAANLRKGLLMAHRARSAGDAVKLAEAEKIIADNS